MSEWSNVLAWKAGVRKYREFESPSLRICYEPQLSNESFVLSEDIRSMQRFYNDKRGFKKLEEAIELNEQKDLTDLEEQGLIQAFELGFPDNDAERLSFKSGTLRSRLGHRIEQSDLHY